MKFFSVTSKAKQEARDVRKKLEKSSATNAAIAFRENRQSMRGSHLTQSGEQRSPTRSAQSKNQGWQQGKGVTEAQNLRRCLQNEQTQFMQRERQSIHAESGGRGKKFEGRQGCHTECKRRGGGAGGIMLVCRGGADGKHMETGLPAQGGGGGERKKN